MANTVKIITRPSDAFDVRPYAGKYTPDERVQFDIDEERQHLFVVDLKEFSSSEVVVTTKGRRVFLEAGHEERPPKEVGGIVHRGYTAKYDLPEGCIVGQIASEMYGNGVLIIGAPKAEGGLHRIDVEPKTMMTSGRVVPMAVPDGGRDKRARW